MFALNVRSLDGRCRRISVGPTLAEVRFQLEQSLPALCDIKLFDGDRELTDGAVVEVEVQSVITRSPDKAIMMVKEELPEHRDSLKMALAMLDEIGELSPAQAEELFKTLHHHWYNGVSMTVDHWKFWRDHLHAAEVFGRVCGDPNPFFSRLQASDEILSFNTFSAAALCEIAARCGGDSLPSHLRNDLVQLAKDELRYCLEEDWEYKKRNFYFAKIALRVIGALGEKMQSTCELVNNFLCTLKQVADAMFEELVQDAADVLRQICPVCTQREDASVNADSELGIASQAPANSDKQVGQAVGTTEIAAETGVDSDPVLIHQQDLQEAIMRSKADGPPPICYDDSVVILRLTRCCEENLQALCNSPALDEARKRVHDAGCSLFPDSARGACLLVPLTDEQLVELGLQLEKYHILAHCSLKPAIVEALRMVTPGRRPKIRDDHRASPIKEERPFPEDLQGSVPATGNDIFEDIELLHPYTRAKIRKILAANEGMSETSSISMVTESAPCADAPYEKECKKSQANPRHWK